MKKTSKRTNSTSAKKTRRRTRITTRKGSIDIEHGLGRMKSARAIAQSFKKAADASENLTTAPFHAAMAALDQLIAFLDRQKKRLEAAKIELRKLYGEPTKPTRRTPAPDSSSRPRRRSTKDTLDAGEVSMSNVALELIPT